MAARWTIAERNGHSAGATERQGRNLAQRSAITRGQVCAFQFLLSSLSCPPLSAALLSRAAWPAAAETAASVCHGGLSLCCLALCSLLRARASGRGCAVASSLAGWRTPLARGVSVLRWHGSMRWPDSTAASRQLRWLTTARRQAGASIGGALGYLLLSPVAGLVPTGVRPVHWPSVLSWSSAGVHTTERQRERNAVTETRRRRSALWMQQQMQGAMHVAELSPRRVFF
jgi:hypothetical protein